MNVHIRLVSSETAGDAGESHNPDETADRDEAPIGLPEEVGSNRNEMLGDAPPPLVAEPGDRPTGAREKKGVARRIGFVWRRKAKAPAPVAGEENDGERKEGAPADAEEAKQGPDGGPGKPAVEGGDHPVGDHSRGQDGAAVAAAAKAKRPFLKRNGALVAALAASVAFPAIVVLNWPHSAPQPVVEPGMLADGQTKVMAPSAALATAPPREAPNVSRDRPLVNETRGELVAWRPGVARRRVEGVSLKRRGGIWLARTRAFG
jgi:hypothetical protein